MRKHGSFFRLKEQFETEIFQNREELTQVPRILNDPAGADPISRCPQDKDFWYK
jgi:hypothetical protein